MSHPIVQIKETTKFTSLLKTCCEQISNCGYRLDAVIVHSMDLAASGLGTESLWSFTPKRSVVADLPKLGTNPPS